MDEKLQSVARRPGESGTVQGARDLRKTGYKIAINFTSSQMKLLPDRTTICPRELRETKTTAAVVWPP
jgi:hypothetical protein